MQGPNIFMDKDDLPADVTVIEAYESALRELFYVRNPYFKKGDPKSEPPLQEFLQSELVGHTWIEYPWKNIVVHTIEEGAYFELRTARNRDLIYKEEQESYRNLKVGIAGLSVGSAIVEALVRSGGPKQYKVADFDIVEISNLNRIKANVTDFGQDKTLVAARRIWEIDPFADIELWNEGVTEEGLLDFITGAGGLDVFIDAMDSLDLKVQARFLCREKGIPVVMATDVGDGVTLDIERYDQESDRKVFHGIVDEDEVKHLKDFSRQQWLQLAAKIVGPEQPVRMKQSLMQIGKTIAALPQLGTSAMLAGTVVAYVLRRIAHNQNMPSGKYNISLEKLLDPDFNSAEAKAERKRVDEVFESLFKK